jgi:hypothetical protein
MPFEPVTYDESMTDAEYLTYLYDRAAQRYGYASHAEWVEASTGGSYRKWRAKVDAEERADREAWAKAVLAAD